MKSFEFLYKTNLLLYFETIFESFLSRLRPLELIFEKLDDFFIFFNH